MGRTGFGCGVGFIKVTVIPVATRMKNAAKTPLGTSLVKHGMPIRSVTIHATTSRISPPGSVSSFANTKIPPMLTSIASIKAAKSPRELCPAKHPMATTEREPKASNRSFLAFPNRKTIGDTVSDTLASKIFVPNSMLLTQAADEGFKALEYHCEYP
jgi:hypothetical protein